MHGRICRQSEPDDAVSACTWLISDAACYVTRETFGVNGSGGI
jgi:hypothetical protein